ncbi:MAG: hypothetical protein KDB53_18935 [Planctomycetes bacterium]|nr:hypothetical protein [Planctomycetota bacterium]
MIKYIIAILFSLISLAAPSWAQLPKSKTTIAVAKFDANESFRRVYGDTDLGGGLSAMLASALERSGRFIVVERAELQGSLAEQKLKQDGLVYGPSGARSGKLIGARFLVYGSVTQFDQAESSSGFDIGIGGGGLFGGLSPRSTTGRVGIVLRLVDTTTGRIVETIRETKKVTESGVDFKLGSSRHGFNLGSSQVKKTPVGKAAQRVIDAAVSRLIALSGTSSGWRGLVVNANGQDVWVNGGQGDSLRVGQILDLSRETEALTDPATGEVLDRISKRLGQLRIVEVRARVSRATPVGSLAAPAQRGDVLVLFVPVASANRGAPDSAKRPQTARRVR